MTLILSGTDGLSDVDGSAATPAIRGTDANTGIFFPAADTIAFAEGGAEAMRIDSSGNVGIGTSSPNAASRATILSSGTSTSAFGNVALRLSSNGSGYASTLVFSDEVANSAGISMVSGNLVFGAAGFNTERMRIDSSGNLLVTNPAGLGYGTGAGGTVTQATNKSTAVTLNKPTGQVTTNNAALGAGATVSFSINNSIISATDVIVLAVTGGSSYTVEPQFVSGGVANIRLTNTTGGSLSEAVVINFAVIKGATS